MKVSTIFLACVILSFFLIPVVQAQEDLIKKAQNISITVPPTGSAVAGTKQSMYRYEDWLNRTIAPLISLINQIMELLGLQNTDYTKQMQDAFRTGQNMIPFKNSQTK